MAELAAGRLRIEPIEPIEAPAARPVPFGGGAMRQIRRSDIEVWIKSRTGFASSSPCAPLLAYGSAMLPLFNQAFARA